MKIEKWSKTTEAEVARETKDASAGAPYIVAHMGQQITVTRRCAHEMFMRGVITGAHACRGSGGGMKEVRADMVAQRLREGSGISFKVAPSGKAGTFMLYCPEMNFEGPTKNPAQTMMLLATEWWEMIDHGNGSFEAEVAGDWRLNG
jgi:hypothetical protein